MLVPIEWLKDYTDINVDTKEFCDRMIMSGSNLETCEYFCEEMENVVVGRIEKIEKHPDADKLVVCQVNVGKDELLQIVTGAPNVFEGAYVPVALDGSRKMCIRDRVNAPDQFGMLLASGIVAMIAIQVVLNIAVVTSSMPPTGVTLPFVSYGGNALMLFMGSMGILLNISRHTAQVK